MFNIKYKVNFLDSKWQMIKKDVSLLSVPNKNEYLYLDDKYFEVINIVHDLRSKHTIYIVLEPLNDSIIINKVIF